MLPRLSGAVARRANLGASAQSPAAFQRHLGRPRSRLSCLRSAVCVAAPQLRARKQSSTPATCAPVAFLARPLGGPKPALSPWASLLAPRSARHASS
eukprot:11557300-Alexandrium_andersonii.AAC.1